MRVTGGELSGRRLRAPRGGAVRPTGDRVREALFGRLDLEGCRVLDLFAGSGALGIEALSRGAAEAVFVERAVAPLASLRANLSDLDLDGRARVLRSPVLAGLRRLIREQAAFDLVLLDPPYDAEGTEEVLAILAASGLLAPDGLVVIEAAVRRPPGEVPGLAALDERRYGDTLIRRYRLDPQASGERTGRSPREVPGAHE